MKKDYKYYQEKNGRKSRMLNLIFIADIDNENYLYFFKDRFDTYCNDTTEFYAELCNKSFFRDSQLEHTTIDFFKSHLKNFTKILKKGLEHQVVKENLSYIIDGFLSINFGSFITKEYIISQLNEVFEDKYILLQFESLAKLLEKKNEQMEQQEELILDYSDTTITEKIIYLHRLGVLDFLKSKLSIMASTNLMAKYLSAITGHKAGTIQSYINPIYSKNAIQKSNPLRKEKNVEKVGQNLIEMGFRTEDFV